MKNYDSEGFEDVEVQEHFLKQMTHLHMGFSILGSAFIVFQVLQLL